MSKANKRISQNTPESEINTSSQGDLEPTVVIKMDEFRIQNEISKPCIRNLVNSIAREVNRYKLNYIKLKYIFRLVREKCQICVPSDFGRKLYELPNTEELKRFYEGMDDPIHRLFFEFLENTGLRVAELCNLDVKRIDFEKNLIFVCEGKGKKDRITVFGNRLSEKIKIYLSGRNNRYLFESNRNTQFTPRRIEQICKVYKEKAAITKKFTPHTFRHLFFTRLAEAGVDKERRALLAGHSNEDTQTIYTHLGIAGIKDEIIKVLDSDPHERCRV